MASNYIPGYINSMDVCGFGFNTQSAMFWQSQHAALDVHNNVTCDGCGASPLRGIRWHCKSCPDHDICNNCKKQNLFAGHPFEIMSMTSTNNANAIATGGQVTAEAGVHWTKCQGCGMSPIKGTLYTCTVCPKYDMCQSCNTQRIQNPEAHPHRFDFNYMPVAANPPPTQAGGPGPGAGAGLSAGRPMDGQTQYAYGPPPMDTYQSQQQLQGSGGPPMPHYDRPDPSRFDRLVHYLQWGSNDPHGEHY